MVYKCFICNEKSDTEPKIYMFKPTRATLEEWKKIISRNDRELKLSHRICEKHFHPNDIIRFDIYCIQGKEVRLPKILPVLKLGAKPLKSDIYLEDLKQKYKKKKSKKPTNQEKKLKNDESCTNEELYDELNNQLDSVPLPSKEWALHRLTDIASFVHISYDATRTNIVMDKAIIFNNSLTPICIFKEIKSDLQVFCNSLDAVTGVLKYVDSAQICASSTSPKCKGYVLSENTNICTSCNFDNENEQYLIKTNKRK